MTSLFTSDTRKPLFEIKLPRSVETHSEDLDILGKALVVNIL